MDKNCKIKSRSILFLFQYFVHSPGFASTARYRVLINKMCLWIYCCGMTANILTRAKSLRFSCSDYAPTLRFNRSNKSSIEFKSRMFADHLILCTLFASSITSVLLAAWHDVYRGVARDKSMCRHHWSMGRGMPLRHFWHPISPQLHFGTF